ncbi:bifunctional salicylyl-CoA 5-hydroxylase/oxidoreductase [Rubrivirga sp. IMCC43871]|uniref:bifunctional salicylyl-CoA 5-hydroxylase/oxidoreductase n=1 Tax=Rubrivirga sp. IMCC43871 TaxID=3391575 RepID=UPI00398F947E
MTVACVGGGPAGLFLAILLKKARPGWDVAVYEQNPRGNTFGWGIVFSDGTMENLVAADPEVAEATQRSLAHWDDVEVRFRGRVLRSSGHGFIGVGRHRFIEILTDRAEALGVALHFGVRVDELERLEAGLIVAADGVNSALRASLAGQFEPVVAATRNRFTWLGTRGPFPAFTFDFQETEWGWFQAHAYQFSDDTSTCIVECTDETWRAAGLGAMAKADALAFCERLFADLLDGHPLLDNAPHLEGPEMWLRFPTITNARWYAARPDGTPVVLLGDAAATAHFSIGSGTKLALESALALAHGLTEAADLTDLGAVLEAYEDERRVEVLRLQNAARNSTEWFEQVELRGDLAPEQFAYSLLTRSQRVSHENLRVRDADWLADYEAWWAGHQTGEPDAAVPPMFVPYHVRGLTLANRIVVSPMAMYSADDGVAGDFHLVHLGQRALGGAGLVFTEMTCPSPDARITPGCAGLWTDQHTEAWARIVRFIHQNSPAKAALQLGHAGRKGSAERPWDADGDDTTPLADGNWPLMAPSALPYLPHNQIPREMDRADMDRVLGEFVAATHRGAQAGFDWLELHCAHGYLLSSFLSPLTNRRTDAYGGSLDNRLRFPLEVWDAMRAVWPEDKPMSVRLSASDWVDGGTTIDDAVEMARAFYAHGADLIDVSSGQVSPDQKPVYGRMWQTPFAERIRLEVGAPVMAVGNIYEPDHVNSILAAGRADLCLLARPHLGVPHWTLRAAAELGYIDQWWPPPYHSGKRQLERIFERQKQADA